MIMFQVATSIFLACVIFTSIANAATTDPKQAAQNLYGTYVKPVTGTGKALNDNYTRGLTTGSNIKSLDGKSSFATSTFKDTGNLVLRVTSLFEATTGALSRIAVEQSTAANGTIDYAYVAPPASAFGEIPAVCNDGFIACSPGTYDSSCTYWKWVSDETGKVSASNTKVVAGTALNYTINDLSGCYCFSNFCTGQPSSSLVNLPIISEGVGTAVMGAMLAKAGFVLSKVKGTDTGSISYYGVKAEGKSKGTVTATPMSTAEPSSVENFYSDGQLSAAANAEVEIQAKDSKSLYSMMSGVASSVGAGRTQVECHNITTGRMDYETTDFSGVGNGSVCTDRQIYMRIIPTDTFSYRLSYIDTGWGLGQPHKNCPSPGGDGWWTAATVAPNLDPAAGWQVALASFVMTDIDDTTTYEYTDPFTGDVTYNTYAGCVPSASASVNILNGDFSPIIDTKVACNDTGAQTPRFNWHYNFTFARDHYVESTSNQCAPYEGKCTLRDEWFDGKPVVQMYMPTKFDLNRLECKNFTGKSRTERQCRQVWDDRRVYDCKSDTDKYFRSGYFSDAQKRVKKAQDTVKLDGERMSYDDLNLGTGATTGMSTKVVPDSSSAPCENSCKVRVKSAGAKVMVNGTSTSLQSKPELNKDSEIVSYKVCDAAADGTQTCPVDEGEEIVQNCLCKDDFPEAMAAIGAAAGAAGDAICSK